MKGMAAGLLVLLMASPVQAGIRASEAALIAAAGADLATTEWALGRCGTTCREGNPFMQAQGTRAAAKLAGTAAVLIAARALEKRKHKHAARILRWGGAALWGAVAVQNYRRAR